MCAEFEQHVPAMQGWADVLEHWPNPEAAQDAQASGHVFPTDACWTFDSGGFAQRSWSLIPAWADAPKLKFSTFNARAETLAEKPVFRQAWQHGQRCLIPASRYYEWGVTPSGKRKHEVWAADGQALMMAGLYERWTKDAQLVDSCTVVTVAASAAMQKLHGRMPLLLDAPAMQIWLQGAVKDAGVLMLRAPEIDLRYRMQEPTLKPGQTGSLF